MDEQTLANIRSRIERCRRLAAGILDPSAAKILGEMADEGQADLDRLLRGTERQADSGA